MTKLYADDPHSQPIMPGALTPQQRTDANLALPTTRGTTRIKENLR